MNYHYLNAEELLEHQDYFIDFAKNDIESFKFIPAKLRNQNEFILNFLNYFDNHPEVYSEKYVSAYCKEIMGCSLVFGDDKDIVLKLTEKNSICVEYASERLRGDKEVVLVAVKASARDTNGNQHYFSHYTFRSFSEEIKEKLYKMNSYDEVIKYLESEILHDNLHLELVENKTVVKKIKI